MCISVAFFTWIDKSRAPINGHLYARRNHANKWISNENWFRFELIHWLVHRDAGSSCEGNTIEFAVSHWCDSTTENDDKHSKILFNAHSSMEWWLFWHWRYAISMAIDDRKLLELNYKYKLPNFCCPFLRRAHWNERRARISSVFRLRSIRLMQIVSHMYDKQISTAAKMKCELKIKCCFFCCRRHETKRPKILFLLKHRKQWNLAI